jgi:hypothetical protein
MSALQQQQQQQQEDSKLLGCAHAAGAMTATYVGILLSSSCYNRWYPSIYNA